MSAAFSGILQTQLTITTLISLMVHIMLSITTVEQQSFEPIHPSWCRLCILALKRHGLGLFMIFIQKKHMQVFILSMYQKTKEGLIDMICLLVLFYESECGGNENLTLQSCV